MNSWLYDIDMYAQGHTVRGAPKLPLNMLEQLRREGVHIETENDTEVGAAYLTWKMQNGASLGEALESSLAV